MSYDLFFYREPSPSVDELEAYFEQRSRYTLNPKQAWYENEDTGVYFCFDLGSVGEPGQDRLVAAFNINYNRPSFFILEAEPEVTEFVQAFGLSVEDPQEGMRDGAYDSAALKAGWEYGNRSAFRVLAREPDMVSPHSLPSAALLDAWSWNLGRAALQSNLGEACFVPAVWFWLVAGELVTAALWPDGIPIVVPHVDALAISRRELAPRKMLKRTEDLVFVTMHDAAPILEAHRARRADALFVLDYDSPPSDVRAFVKTLPEEKRSLERLAPDHVIDRELVR